MKTRTIITAALILFSVVFANAGSKERTLSFSDSLGRLLTMPVMIEIAEETPFDTQSEFNRIRTNHVNRLFDISEMNKPEEAEPLPFDLDAVLETIK